MEKQQYINEAMGYVIVNQHDNKLKQLSATEIGYLKNYFNSIYLNKLRCLNGEMDGDSLYIINRRVAVNCHGHYVGNRWATWCNINQKTGLFLIEHSEYGMINTYVAICDTGLEKITENMYQQLEAVHKEKAA